MNKPSIYFFTVLFFISAFFIIEYPKFKAFNDGLLHVYFMDIGQGDASLVKLPSKKLVLVDAGPNADVLESVSEHIPLNITKIDLVIVSHSHADHITGLISILDNYDIGCVVYDNEDENNSETESYLRELLALNNVKVLSTTELNSDYSIPESCFKDPDVTLKAYSIRNISEADEDKIKKNQNLESNIVMLDYKDFEVLFTGDAEADIQAQILPLLRDDIELLKVPHQGSFDSYYPDLITKLKPNYAVFSVGMGNSYGHPHKEVIEGYSNLNLRYSRTDKNGTVKIRTDGIKWDVALEKD